MDHENTQENAKTSEFLGSRDTELLGVNEPLRNLAITKSVDQCLVMALEGCQKQALDGHGDLFFQLYLFLG